MKTQSLLLLLALSIIGAFATLNWDTFITPTTLSLGITSFQAPLGLVMLGLLAFVTLLFLVFVVYMQATVLIDSRRHTREMQANRTLADKAEASRFTELRGFLDAELKRLAEQDAVSRAAVQARLDQLDHELRAAIEQSGNTLAAYIGELEDRLENGGHRPALNPPV
ncbi:MAG: LapA family protein [Georgfuchsia sp.]